MPVNAVGEQRVAVAPDRIAGIGRRGVLVAEIRGELGVARGGELGRGRELGVVGTLRGEGAEERIGVALAAPGRRHLGTRQRLAPRRDEPLLDSDAQRFFDALERRGNAGHAFGRGGPVVVGLEAHEVEALARTVDRARDDPDVAEALTGVELIDLEGEALDHHTRREPVVERLGRRRLQRGDGLAGQVGAACRTLGREVGHLVVVAGNPGAGRAARVERTELVAIAIGDGEDFRHVSSSGWPVR